MRWARRRSALVLVFGIGAACRNVTDYSFSNAPEDPTQPAPSGDTTGETFGGQTGSGAYWGIECNGSGWSPTRAGPANGCDSLFELGDYSLPRFAGADAVRSLCLPASRLDASLPGSGVCQCTIPTLNHLYAPFGFEPVQNAPLLVGSGAQTFYVGLNGVLGASGVLTDPCEVRQTFLTDSVCLFEGSEFTGCSESEPYTSCAQTCELVRTRADAESEGRRSQIEPLVSPYCEAGCGLDNFCFGAFRIGDRCYGAQAKNDEMFWAEVSCDLSLEQTQGATACVGSESPPLPPAYCLDGTEASVLASSSQGISHLAQDDLYVYWLSPLDLVNEGSDEAAIFRVPKTGGAVEKVTDVYDTLSLRVDSSRIYWQSRTWHSIFSLPVAGGSSPVLLADDANGIWTASDSQVYYTSVAGEYSGASPAASLNDLPEVQLRVVPDAGGMPVTLLSQRRPIDSMGSDATGVYWSQDAYSVRGLDSFEILKYTFADQSVTTFAAMGYAGVLSTAGGRVLWTAKGVGWSSAPDGTGLVGLGPITDLPGLALNSQNFTTDGTTAYWTSADQGGNIVAVPIGGGPARLQRCSVFDARSMLADDSSLFILLHGDTIARLPKSAL